MVILKRLFWTWIKKPPTSYIIVLSNQWRNTGVWKLDRSELIFIIQGKGTCNTFFEESVIIQEDTYIWKEN